jgi:hypothetical protein
MIGTSHSIIYTPTAMPLRFRGRPIFPPLRDVFVFPAPGWKDGSLLWRAIVVVVWLMMISGLIGIAEAVWNCLVIGGGPGRCVS